MDIHHFLALPHRFRWGGVGGDDCLTFPASWVERVSGIDPADEFRGTYSTCQEAQRILDFHGGNLALMERQLSPIKAKRILEPDTGDIGLIKAMTGETFEDQAEALIGAIRFGPLWACIHPSGVRAIKAEFVAAWRLPA
ncbi:DUF6950 family protein [Rhizobium sp. ZK1]|uniref:DUF6950 family protein n=1 Tax=Rhizobium sp. ZK1 TaxID=3389872 RepID=UPI0039F731FD